MPRFIKVSMQAVSLCKCVYIVSFFIYSYWAIKTHV